MVWLNLEMRRVGGWKWAVDSGLNTKGHGGGVAMMMREADGHIELASADRRITITMKRHL
jgi:hypothetical protein